MDWHSRFLAKQYVEVGMRPKDPHEERARELAIKAGIDPDSRVPMPGKDRTMPAWVQFRLAARQEKMAEEARALAKTLGPQKPQYQNSPLTVVGEHEEATIQQMRNCMSVGNVVAGALCADGHLGYAQPVGGVIAYEGQISISGVGFDIACGNLAVKLDTRFADIADRVSTIAKDIARTIPFGLGRDNPERVEHELFDDDEAWEASGMEDYRQKAAEQLGTVGAGNHYVDVFEGEKGHVWIGAHFGSRGLGHTTATRYLKMAGGKEGMNVPPAVVDEHSEIGRSYIAGMKLAGRYAYAGREWVVERVRQIIRGSVLDTVHNHHNYAWQEEHFGRRLWVVRKGATPAFPGQRSFVGGSMGDEAVILEGYDSEQARNLLRSTIHGAGRLFGRREARRRFSRKQMEDWLREIGVTLIGGDLDESPMAYRRLEEVLAYHLESVRVLHRLRPRIVVMAGRGEFFPSQT